MNSYIPIKMITDIIGTKLRKKRSIIYFKDLLRGGERRRAQKRFIPKRCVQKPVPEREKNLISLTEA